MLFLPVQMINEGCTGHTDSPGLREIAYIVERKIQTMKRIIPALLGILLTAAGCSEGEVQKEQLPLVQGLKVDGERADWEGQGIWFPLVTDQFGNNGTGDLTCDLLLGWDEDGLWFLADVTDDEVILREGDTGRGEMLEIFISAEKCTDQMVQYLMYPLKGGGVSVNKFDYNLAAPFPGVHEISVKTITTAGGYRIEGFIPARLYNSEMMTGQQFSLNFNIADTDSTGRSSTPLFINSNTYTNHCELRTLTLGAGTGDQIPGTVVRAWTRDREELHVQLIASGGEPATFSIQENKDTIIEAEMPEKEGWYAATVTVERSALSRGHTGFRVHVGETFDQFYYFRDVPMQFEAVQPEYNYEEVITMFEESDRIDPPGPDPVLFLGSSTIRLWYDVAGEFPDEEVILRGFGGSRTIHALHYFDRIVKPYNPSVIVYFFGNNDINRGTQPHEIVENVALFIERVREELPGTRVLVVSPKPSFSRIGTLPEVRETNRLLRDMTGRYPEATFVDVYSSMVDAEGEPLDSLFSSDGTHMNKAGYALWAEKIRPLL